MIDNAQVTPPARRRVMHLSYVAGLSASALARGARRVSLTQVHWDASADCEHCVTIELEGREDAPRKTEHENIVWFRDHYWFADVMRQGWPLSLVMEVPCRRCPSCLARRAAHWRLRAESEISGAARTWFGTLTLRPEVRFRVLLEATQRVEKRGTAWSTLTPDEVFRAKHAVISEELTRWLKRIRKESGAPLRYCLVAEAHKDGDPHYHCLIHEPTEWGVVGERTLRRQWAWGFSKFALVREKGAAAYVAKYLAKAALARVRASVRYGNNALSA